MFDVNDVASFFIDIANDENTDDNITNLKLQKLLFFAQGWNLVRNGSPLFNDEIEAWKNGPVVRSVYYLYQCCGRNPITECLEGDYRNINDENVREVLFDVYAEYGKYVGEELLRMTHEPGTPWSERYFPGANNIIDHKLIKDYFSELSLPKSCEDIPNKQTIEALNDELVTEKYDSVDDLMRYLNA